MSGKCKICGRELTSADYDGTCNRCRENSDPVTPHIANFGWVCPKCGAVYSPATQSCWICMPKVIT